MGIAKPEILHPTGHAEPRKLIEQAAAWTRKHAEPPKGYTVYHDTRIIDVPSQDTSVPQKKQPLTEEERIEEERVNVRRMLNNHAELVPRQDMSRTVMYLRKRYGEGTLDNIAMCTGVPVERLEQFGITSAGIFVLGMQDDQRTLSIPAFRPGFNDNVSPATVKINRMRANQPTKQRV